jgi:cardiolipin synthase
MYKTNSVFTAKEDFLNTMKLCEQITLDDCRNVNFFIKIGRTFLKVFAPLM